VAGRMYHKLRYFFLNRTRCGGAQKI
jgi:hypothetical protein